MTKEIKNDIARSLNVNIKPTQILSSLRVSNPLTADEAADSLSTSADSMLRPRNIYNLKAEIRRKALGPLTPMQAILQKLNEDDWMYQYETGTNDHLTHLFVMQRSSEKILKQNHEVLTMNSTYKTNRYKMPLLIISGQTAMNTNFYVAFCFLSQEKVNDYR